MSLGLSVSRVVTATVNLSPTAAQGLNLNSALIMGDSDVIDVSSRIRSYTTLAAVASDFGTTAPEYVAAALFFAQAPQPTQLYIGKWAQSAVAGRLLGAPLSATQQLLSNFTSLTSSGFKIQVDAAATPVAVAVGTLAGATNLNAVASAINAGLTTAAVGAVCVWNAAQSRFEIKSNTTGTTSKVLPLTAPTSGNDLSILINMTAALGATEVDGIVAETAVAAVAILDNLPTYWYALTVASTHIVDADHIAIASYIQGAQPHIYGVTTNEAAALSATATTDIGYVLMNGGYTRTFVQWSSSSLYAAASMLGRILTVDYTANKSTITLFAKQEPSVQAETLTNTQSVALDSKRYNYFVNFNNSTAIIMNGWMSGPAFIDEITGTDWLANACQTAAFNLLYTSTTKIPQTDDGMNQLVNVCDGVCAQGVANGLLAGGVWTTGGFGSLKQGDTLPKGYYIYAPPVATQLSADRSARKATTIQIAAKLAGAIQSANIIINVNR